MGPPGGPGLYVTNYDALRALDASQYTSGYQAVVGGYATVNDGGGGVFIYVPSASADDNDGTILAPSNLIGRWYRSYSGPVNVRWFGAVGDGSTDDAVAFQNAITFIETLTLGGEIFVPSGDYLHGAALTISGLKPFRLFGEGQGCTILTFSGVINGLEMGSGSADRTVDLRISNMSIVGEAGADIGIVVNKLHQILLDRIRISGFVTAGVDMNMAYNNELRDLYIEDCDRGIIVDENNEYTLMIRCKVYTCATIGIHFRNGSCSGSKIMFCDIEGNGVGIQVDCGTAENVESFGVIGCYFKDQVGANALFGTDASAFFIDSLLFQNNEIKSGQAGAATCTVELDLCRKPVVMSNFFRECDFVTTVNCEDLVELGNSFDASAEPTEVQLGNASGNLRAGLPGSDPGVPDELWNNSGDVYISI